MSYKRTCAYLAVVLAKQWEISCRSTSLHGSCFLALSNQCFQRCAGAVSMVCLWHRKPRFHIVQTHKMCVQVAFQNVSKTRAKDSKQPPFQTTQKEYRARVVAYRKSRASSFAKSFQKQDAERRRTCKTPKKSSLA